ncbi:SpoIIE family protein phosphatase [Goekera deserti]|uniref:SpoIIE family protein phosphatase n=1 Tax=Goekera deserti TaxID=2497753 RepID=A0A7K3WF34_9ACTN|nr:SpoIIE family protein phosphatase [Goekera deserti]NDI48513.1 SpoIIE family protein phosphatase [Goekera deserti]NEL55108.1 SpoIIE family protein phosphatase [Goekera deserti]
MFVGPGDTAPGHCRAADAARLSAVRATGLVGGDPGPALSRLVDTARTVLRAPYAFLTVVDDAHSHFVAQSGTSAGADTGLPIAESYCRFVVDTGEPLVLGDVRLDERTRDNPAVHTRELVSWAGHPVHTPDGHVLGTLCVSDTTPREWTAADRTNLAVLAEGATREVALRAALAAADEAVRTAQASAAVAERAAAEARRAQERQALFARIGELLTAGLDLPAVWEAVVRLAVPAVADYAFVHAVERDALAGQFLLHRDPARQAVAERLTNLLPRRLSDRSGPGLVARTGVTQVVQVIDPHSPDLSAEQRTAVVQLHSISSISVALRARGQVSGVLTVVRVQGSTPYSDDDVVLVETIAARAALALDNALAYQQERRASLRLQRALLPELLPHPEQLDLAARYRPAGRRQVVGGDWYDAFVDGRSATTLVIGDVAGHDIAAAAAMGQLRAMIRMAGHDGRLSPAEVFTAVDAATDGLGTSVFATAQLAQVQRAGPAGDVTLRWTSAGHLPPVVVDADGRARLLDSGADRPLGLALPADAAGRRRDRLSVLRPGETLVLYTDGLVEGRGHDLDAGTTQLLHAAAGTRGLPADDVCGALLESLGTPGSDDIALLVLRNPARPAG